MHPGLQYRPAVPAFRRLFLALLLLPTLCADDCSGPYAVAAIHPLYSDSTTISDNRLLGSWVSEHDTMTILSEGEGRYLADNFSRAIEEGATRSDGGPMHLRLFQMGESEMADWTDDFWNGDDPGTGSSPLHFPLLVKIAGDTLLLSLIEPKPLYDSTGAWFHDPMPRIVRGDALVLRGRREDVVGFLQRYLADSAAIDYDQTFVRVRLGEGPEATSEAVAVP